ncbi:alpha/beta hydrolase [Rhizobium sp. SIMBA_035]
MEVNIVMPPRPLAERPCARRRQHVDCATGIDGTAKCTIADSLGTEDVPSGLLAMIAVRERNPVRGCDINVGGRKVHVLEEGKKAAASVVLLHGCGSLAQEVLAPFSATGLHIVAPDRPGYGFSEPLSPGQRGPLAQSVWLEQLIEVLHLQDVTLAGHSIGCAPLLLLANRRPDLAKALFLIAPFCRPTPQQTMLLLRLAVAPGVGPLFARHVVQRFASYFGRRAMRAAHHPNPIPEHLLDFPYPHAANHQTLRTMADELWGFNADMQRVPELKISCPIQVICGDADAVVDPDGHLDWLAKRVPQIELRWLHGIGHNPHHAAPEIASSMLCAVAAADATEATKSKDCNRTDERDRRRQLRSGAKSSTELSSKQQGNAYAI